MTSSLGLRFRALLTIGAALAIASLAATAVMADCGVTHSISSAMPAPGASSAITSPTTAAPSAVTGMGAASSLTPNAWIVKGDPGSDNLVSIHGAIGFGVRDISDLETGTLKDSLQFGLARLHDPSDNSAYEIKFTGLDKADPKFGGVALLKPVFGDTGIGESTLPETLAYIAAWGVADVFKNGNLIASATPAHVLVVPGIRNASTGMLLPADGLDLNAREIILHVPGPVSGLMDGSLVAFWPNAALELRDVGGKPMSQQAIATAIVPGLPTGVVAGEAVEVAPQRIQFSLRNNDFLSYIPPDFATGYTRITVVNNSMVPRGAIVRATDIADNPTIRYIPVLAPGKSYSYFTYLGPGRFNIMEYRGAWSLQGMRHWRSNYQTTFEVSP